MQLVELFGITADPLAKSALQPADRQRPEEHAQRKRSDSGDRRARRHEDMRVARKPLLEAFQQRADLVK